MIHKFLIITILLSLLGILLFASVQVQSASANVASIVGVSNYDIGSIVWVNVTINHGFPPAIGPSHYVSNVQLEINGTVQNMSQSPQTLETFSVQYSLGSKGNTYMVRARALCNLHGYSGYSSLVSVPESIYAVLLIVLLGAVVAVVARNTLNRRANTITHLS